MKRIKALLTTITVVAVVSGALAFTAKRQSTIYCGTQGAQANTSSCSVRSQFSYTTNNPNIYCTNSAASGSTCSEFVSTFVDE
jgi:hypothetical protein